VFIHSSDDVTMLRKCSKIPRLYQSRFHLSPVFAEHRFSHYRVITSWEIRKNFQAKITP